MWIMDKVFLLTNFGWVSWMHDDFFILAVSSSSDTFPHQMIIIILYFYLSKFIFFLHPG